MRPARGWSFLFPWPARCGFGRLVENGPALADNSGHREALGPLTGVSFVDSCFFDRTERDWQQWMKTGLDALTGQCIQACLHPLLPVTLGSVEKARVHKRDTSQWPQCFSVSTVVSQRRTILNKPAESTPGRPWEKKRPPPGRPQATDSGHPHGVVFVPGVSIWGFAFFCGENGLNLRNWFCFL